MRDRCTVHGSEVQCVPCSSEQSVGLRRMLGCCDWLLPFVLPVRYVHVRTLRPAGKGGVPRKVQALPTPPFTSTPSHHNHHHHHHTHSLTMGLQSIRPNRRQGPSPCRQTPICLCRPPPPANLPRGHSLKRCRQATPCYWHWHWHWHAASH